MHAQTTVTGKSSGNMSCPLNVPTFLVAVVEDTPSPSATRSEVLAPQNASGTLQHCQDSTKGTECKRLVSPLGCLSLCVPWGLFCTLTLSQGPLKSNNNTISDPPVGTARFVFFFLSFPASSFMSWDGRVKKKFLSSETWGKSQNLARAPPSDQVNSFLLRSTLFFFVYLIISQNMRGKERPEYET